MKDGLDLIQESIKRGETVRVKWTPELGAELYREADSVGTGSEYNIYSGVWLGDRWTVVLTKEPTK